MKKRKHINFEQRKTISSSISHKMKVKVEGELLDLDSTLISREVKIIRGIIHLILKISHIVNKKVFILLCYIVYVQKISIK